MIAICLSLLLVQAPTSHADLHPQDSDFFLEIPGAAAALQALKNAPMVQMIGDDEVADIIAQYSEGLDLNAFLESALADSLGFPTGGLWTDRVTSLSLSGKLHPASQTSSASLGVGLIADFVDAESATLARDMITNLGAEPMFPPKSPLADTKFFDMPDPVGMTGWASVIGNRLVVGTGPFDPASYAVRAGGEAASLATDESFVMGMRTFGEPSGTVLVQGFTRAGAMGMWNEAKQLRPKLIPGMPEGLTNLEATMGDGMQTWRMQLEGSRYVTEHLHEGSSDGAGELLGAQDVDAEWLALAPPQAMFLYATTVDGAEMANTLRGFLGSVGGAGQVAAFEESLGFGLDRVFSRVGPGMVTYAMPPAGISIPETYVWLEVQDQEAFQADMELIWSKVNEFFPEISARTRDYRVRNRETKEKFAFPVTSINLPEKIRQPAPMVSFDPGYAFVDGRLLLGVKSMHVKRELKRVYGGEIEDGGASPLASAGVSIPSDARSVIVMDWGIMIENLVSTVRNLGGMMAGMMGQDLPFDPASLPPAEAFTQFMRPTVHYSQRVEAGLYRRHEASFGPETWTALAGAAAYAQQMMQGGQSTAPAAVAQPVTQEDSLAAEFRAAEAQRQQTRDVLQGVRTGIAVYRLDRGGLPSALTDLTSATDNYPNGFLNTPSVPNDGWGRALRYQKTAADSYRLWSMGPNGRDESGAGDDVLDG